MAGGRPSEPRKPERERMQEMDNGRFKIYRLIVKAWRESGWNWTDVAAAHQLEAWLQRKLQRWQDEDGYPRITPDEWRSLVRDCREEEESGNRPRPAVPPSAAPSTEDPSRVSTAADAAPFPATDESGTLEGTAGTDGFPENGKTAALPAGAEAVASMQDFGRCLAKAPTKVRKLLEALGVDDWEGACCLREDAAIRQPGFGTGTWNAFLDWLSLSANLSAAEADPPGESAKADDPGNFFRLPKPPAGMPPFGKCLSRSPTKVRKLLVEKLGVGSWEDLLAYRKSALADAPGFGRKTLAALEAWLVQSATPPAPVECSGADNASWNDWLERVCGAVMEHSGLDFGESWPIFAARAGLTEEDASGGKPPTLEEVAARCGKTRERVRQIESLYLSGKDGFFRGLPGDPERFGDFLRIVAEVFGDDRVLAREEFARRLQGKLPAGWGDCSRRAERLLDILLNAGERKTPGFVAFRPDGSPDTRFDAFQAALKDCAGREEAEYGAVRDRMASSGCPGLTEGEYAYFREKALKSGAGAYRTLLGEESRSQIIRRMLAGILGPAGKHGMLLPELEEACSRAFAAEFPDMEVPCVRGFIGRGDELDLDGTGLTIWISSQSRGHGRTSRYALSSSWESLGKDLVRALEEELVAHLREKGRGCTAGALQRFLQKWSDEGVPGIEKDMSVFVLRGLLKRDSSGLVEYPLCRGTCAYALPGALDDKRARDGYVGLFEHEAGIYFKGRDLVPCPEMHEFALSVYGYTCEIQARNISARVFEQENGNYRLRRPGNPDGTEEAPRDAADIP